MQPDVGRSARDKPPAFRRGVHDPGALTLWRERKPADPGPLQMPAPSLAPEGSSPPGAQPAGPEPRCRVGVGDGRGAPASDPTIGGLGQI